MQVDITYDQQYFVLSSDYIFELNVVRTALTREIPNAWMLKKITSIQNTDRCFMNNYNMVPVGLWLEVINVCKQNNIQVQFSDKALEYINNFKFIEFEDFKNWVLELFKGAKNSKGKDFIPYDYQIEAAYKLIKFRKACVEISTSGGKTLIAFILFKYWYEMMGIENILFVVPSKGLVKQSNEDFQEYESYLVTHNKDYEIGVLQSGLNSKQKRQVDSCNILFGTFQSLTKKPIEFLSKFKACINDECHHSSADSVKNVITKCTNLIYSSGVTGTFPKSIDYQYLVLQAYIGPVVYKLTADQLINKEKRATPIYAVMEYLNYASQEDKQMFYLLRANKNSEDIQAGAKILKQERLYVNNQYTRLKYICDKAIQTKKNALLLFGDIKYGAGQKFYEYIKENSEKDVYYVDGSTPEQNRAYYIECMENDETGNTIIVASINTFGEGINIKNLWSIFLVDTAKSERLVRQICGRGLRLYPGKDKVLLFDFVDDLRYTEHPDKKKWKDNYLVKHGKSREAIYKEQNFPIYTQKIDFK